MQGIVHMYWSATVILSEGCNEKNYEKNSILKNLFDYFQGSCVAELLLNNIVAMQNLAIWHRLY